MGLLLDYPPTPFFEYVTQYVYSNLFHEQIQVVLLNVYFIYQKQPVGWHYKNHSTVYMGTYSYDDCFGRTCVEYIIGFGIIFDTLVFLFVIKATCLEIINKFLTMPPTLMIKSTCYILQYPSTNSRKKLHIILLLSDSSLEDIILLVSYQIVVFP